MKKFWNYFVISEFFRIFVKQLAIMKIKNAFANIKEKRFANMPARKKQIVENYLADKDAKREALKITNSQPVVERENLFELEDSYNHMSL